jgi:hypothetical protein
VRCRGDGSGQQRRGESKDAQHEDTTGDPMSFLGKKEDQREKDGIDRDKEVQDMAPVGRDEGGVDRPFM